MHKLAAVEPALAFLYKSWWRVQLTNIERLPTRGPALIVGNASGLIPWTALMLMYALMSHRKYHRQVTVAVDADWIDKEFLGRSAKELGFVPWSAENLKQLFAAGELVAIFPPGLWQVATPCAQRYRLQAFDWTRLLPAIEAAVEIFPLATVGCDEAIPTLFTVDAFADLPITPFFPWLPFPLNLGSFPVKWHMSLCKPVHYKHDQKSRDKLEETAKQEAKFIEGELQAELNRILRLRTHGNH